MSMVPIRTITLGLAQDRNLSVEVFQRASSILNAAQKRFANAGYEVQTLRLAMRPLFHAPLAHWSSAEVLKYAQDLQGWLDDVGLEYCSVGPADACERSFPLDRLDLLADVLLATKSLNATVQLAGESDYVRAEAALPTARLIQRLACESEEGFGNFRFAMLARVNPWCPFFPAAYHEGSDRLALGMQGASIVADALRAHLAEQEAGQLLDLVQVTQWVRAALIERAGPVMELGYAFAKEHNLAYSGVDLSPAPLGEDSIAGAIELCGYGPLGSPGTLGVAAALTTALKTTDLAWTCGYNGLMLPVLEDAVLGQRWAEGSVDVGKLLLYSAVCGTGLDTIPLPGDTPTETIAQILLDVATLAVRLQKPLSARLFPVPGKSVGERTTFTSPYLTNTVVRAV